MQLEETNKIVRNNLQAYHFILFLKIQYVTEEYNEKFTYLDTVDGTAIGIILRDRRVVGIVFVAVWINIEADRLSNNPVALAEQKR